jgi:polyisoprenyl-teichoic acid--peptidoglycan teichoic acid transferase
METPSQTASPLKPLHRWRRIVLFFVTLALIAGGVFLVKAGYVFNKISLGDSGFFQSIVKTIPGVKDELKGEKEGRINILLLAMRGENVPGGGLLADTIIVVSLHPKNSEDPNDTARASMVSIPRDLYVKVPGREEQRKINAVYALGEERGKGGGIEDMRAIVGEVTGLDIPYAVVINFQGFIDLVNALGGITVTLDQPFSEGMQFREPKVCDSHVYTVPTRPPQYEHKYYTRKDGSRYIAKSYLLCYNKDLECGGVFELPAGESMLDGGKALCYARARYQSNDFERAKRQQQVIQAIKDKALSAGTLTDFGKINGLLDSLGDNVRVNTAAWEAKRFFELYQGNSGATITQRVLEDSEEGLLYAPPVTEAAGYILLPRGDNYDRIRALFQGLP